VDLEGYEVFIDPMVLNGILAGVLLGIGSLWLLVLRSAIWRAWLKQEHGAALDLASRRFGLSPAEVSVRAMLVVEGQTPQGPVRLSLSAGRGFPVAHLKSSGLAQRTVPGESTDDEWLVDWASGIIGAQQ
jgi:hypothetical protein